MLRLHPKRSRWFAVWAILFAAANLFIVFWYVAVIRSNTQVLEWSRDHRGMIAYDIGVLGYLEVDPVYTGRLSMIELNFDSAEDLSPLAEARDLRSLTICFPDEVPLDLAFAHQLHRLEVLEVQATSFIGLEQLHTHPTLRDLRLFRLSPSNPELAHFHQAAPQVSVTVTKEYHEMNMPWP